MQRWSVKAWIVAAGAVTLAAGATAAIADCYDILGCDNKNLFSNNYSYLVSPTGPNCDFLYTLRNRIYQEHGYCFKTPRAIQELGNQDCRVAEQAAIQLSPIEQANIATLQRAEAAKGCPAG